MDIYLVNGPTVWYAMAKHNLDGGGFNYQTESIIKVYALLLVVAFSPESGFLSFKRVVKVAFGFKYLHGADSI